MSSVGSILFPTIHYDTTEFKKKNPYASERELWNHLDEKYNFTRSAGAMTLEEAQEYILPPGKLSTNPTSLTNSYKIAPNAQIGNNSLMLGVGYKIMLNDGYSLMLDVRDAYMLRYGKALTVQDLGYDPAKQESLNLMREITGFVVGLRRFVNGESLYPKSPFLDSNAAQFLRVIGIDTSQEFIVNGIRLKMDNDGKTIRKV